jgi:hypothetical protein
LASGRRRISDRLAAGLGAFALSFAGCSAGSAVSSSDIATLRAWATRQGVPLGTERSVKLPSGTIAFAKDSYVPIVHLKDGRTCFLLTTELGYKDNFEGIVSCTQPLLPSETVPAQGTYGPYIALTNCVRACGVFEELYVRHVRDDRTYDVYFDLN